MDGRKSLYWICAVFLVSVGCQSSRPPTPTAGAGNNGTPVAHNAARPRLPMMTPYQATQTADNGEKKQLKPVTLVAAGDFYARAAMAPERSAQEREQGLDQARRAYAQALQNDANYLPAQIGLARCYVNLNDMERARTAYERALQIAPSNAVVWHDLGIVYLRLKNWDTALPALEKAVALDNENRQYQNTLGWALARAGRTDESLACFARLYGEAQAHYKLARMLNHMQQGESSRQHLQQAIRKDPNLREAQDMLTALDAPPGAVPMPSASPPGMAAGAQVAMEAASAGQPALVQPIRPVDYQQVATQPPLVGPGPVVNVGASLPEMGLPEPQTTLPPVPPSFQLPPEVIEATPRPSIEPAPEGVEPIRLLPRPPRVR